MKLLPCFPDLRVTAIAVPVPEMSVKNDACVARFPAGVIVTLWYGSCEVRIKVAQTEGRIASSPCDDDLDMEYLPVQPLSYESECSNFGWITASTDDLLSLPVGSMVGLTKAQASDMCYLLDCAMADMARAAYAAEVVV